MNGGGPATQDGKAVVRWNATRHGISSPKPVVPGLEKTEDWESHRYGIMENLCPVGHLEVTLAERVALLSWRLHRVTRYETETIALSQESIEEDIHDTERFRAAMRGEGIAATTHPIDVRWEAAYTKRADSTFRRFPSEKADKVLRAEAAGAIVFGVYLAAKKALGGELDVEALDLPGVPEDAAIEELPAMKVEDVRGCIEVLAAAATVDPAELLEAAKYEAGYQASHAAGKKERIEEDISRKVRERILPDEKTLEKLSRYEAHLSRQLYHALHELENLQKYRTTGEGTPLARLDVQGLSAG
jgi:hypothetical protein